MSVRGKSPSELAASATSELASQERRLRPTLASAVPGATEGDITGRWGDHWVNVESDGTVRIYEKSVGANKLPQWRELISRTVGGTLALPSGTTIGGSAVYVAGGTDVVLADGGTSASLTADNGGIFYSTATAGAILASTATANKVLMSGASAAPSWSTPTFPNASATAGKAIRSDGTNWLASTFTIPDTMAVSTLLYASSANVLSALATGNSGVLVTSGAGVPSIATDIPTAVTIGSAYVYRASGTDVAVADGGTGVGTFTTNGVLYGNGTTSVLVTAQGAANTVLAASAGAPSFSASPTIGTSLTSPSLVATTAVTTPSIITASGALGVTPAAGSNLNVALSTTGDLAVNTSQLYVDTSAARVGIGTAVPAVALDVASTGEVARFGDVTNTDVYGTFRGKDSSSNLLTIGWGVYGAALYNDAWIGSITNHNMAIRTNNVERMLIDTSGNVTLSADLRVDGGDIGLTTDTDLIQIAANSVTINGTLGATTITGMAPSNATYIVQTANATLTSEQVLASLATGLVKSTTTTGVLSIGVADTDYQQPVTWGDGLAYSAPTASVDYNTTNLKITAAQIDTIQSIATAASPTFAGLSISDGNITNVGDIALDTISSDSGSAIVVNDDFTAGNATSDIFNAAGHLEHRAARLQAFTLIIYNSGGVLYHLMVCLEGISTATAATFIDKVTGASTTAAATPSIDATTDFVSGGGICAADRAQFHFNTGAQAGAGLLRVNPWIMGNDSGTAPLYVEPMAASLNVNGTTRTRFALRFWDATRALFLLNTTNIPAGKLIFVGILGFID